MTSLASRLRSRDPLLGYWIALEAPALTEHLATLGWDFVVLDAQHGMISSAGMLQSLIAVDAGAALGSGTVALVRTDANDAAAIGHALDAGAHGVIVPMINSADEARAAVRAARYATGRSFGPSRSQLRFGSQPLDVDDELSVLVMIETVAGLESAAEIAAVDGVDAIFVGPVDLRLALTAAGRADEFDDAIAHLVDVTHAAGRPIGLFTTSGDALAERLAQGFDFGIAGVDYLDAVAGSAAQLARLGRGEPGGGVGY